MSLEPKKDLDIIHPYTFDSSNFKGNAELLFIPDNYDELQKIVKDCYDQNIAMTISGAGTGITGARVPLGGAVISTEKFNSIELINDNTVRVGSAVTLSELDAFLEERNLFLPPNPTEWNASIGGNIATNASGARTFKYGSIRNFVIQINAVLPSGELIKVRRGEIFADNYLLNIRSESGRNINIDLPKYSMPKVKNASGYYTGARIDAIDLFIGSEGTLCIFTEIDLLVIARPENILGGIVFFDDNSKMIEFVTTLRDKSINNNKLDIKDNNELSARLIEFFDKESLSLLRQKYSEIPDESVAAVWIEQEYNSNFEELLLERWYEFISLYTDLSDSTWFAMTDKEHIKLKEFRHELPLQVYENLANNGQKKVGLDTAVPDDSFVRLFNFYLDEFPKLGLDYVIFGHIGNSHLHANIFCKNDDEYNLAKKMYDQVIDLTLQFNGTVSAEHGIGKLKKPYLEKMYGANAINEMRNLKRVFDDKLLLNIGTMFDM